MVSSKSNKCESVGFVAGDVLVLSEDWGVEVPEMYCLGTAMPP